MKKLITALLVVGSLTVTQAEARCCWHGGYWVAPALIGGVVGYELAQPRYYAPPPTVVYTQPSVVYNLPPNPYTTITPVAPSGYHWQQMVDPVTGQTKTVLVPN